MRNPLVVNAFSGYVRWAPYVHFGVNMKIKTFNREDSERNPRVAIDALARRLSSEGATGLHGVASGDGAA